MKKKKNVQKTVDEYTYIFLDSYKKQLIPMMRLIKVKPYWVTIFATLEAVGMDELGVRNKEIINKLKENGVIMFMIQKTN
jgi:hypothetical protein